MTFRQQGAPRGLPAVLVGLLLLQLLAVPLAVTACTTVMAGAKATADGSLLFARTVDYDSSNVANNLVYHPARDTAVTFKAAVNQFQMLLPAPGLAYWGAPSSNPSMARAWYSSSGSASISLEEIGANNAGVVVSATQTIYSNSAALAADPLVEDTGISEDALTSVLLPHPNATSARATVQLLGGLIEKHGSAEGFGVLIGDVTESWYVESGAGHRWLAMRIPDDQFFVSGNQGRFQGVDLSSANAPDGVVLASTGLEAFVIASKLWDPATGAFSFFKAFHEDSAVDASANYPRVRALQTLLGGFTYAGADALAPVFLPPKQPLRVVEDIMAAIRNHQDGTAQDVYLNQTPQSMLDGTAGEPQRPVAILTTGIAHVTRVRAPSDTLPRNLSIINYLSMGTPAWSPFIPHYPLALPANATPAELTGVVYDEPDATSLFWRSRRLSALMFQDWPKLGPTVEAAMRAFDTRVEAELRPAMEGRYTAAVQAGNAAQADQEVAVFTKDVVALAAATLDKLTTDAVAALGLAAMPNGEELLEQLRESTNNYQFGFNVESASFGYNPNARFEYDDWSDWTN